MEELLQKIMIKAYEISNTTKHDVLVNYSGHVNVLDIYYYENGWTKEKELTSIARISLEEKYAKGKLQFILNELEKLEEK